MQNRQNGRRRRSGGNNPRPMGQPMGGQGGSNRLEVKVRGNAHQLLEKYKVLARDAHQAGDRVASEFYLQHADHYFRVLNDTRMRQDEMRARRNIFDPLAEEEDDTDTDAVAETSSRSREEQSAGRESPRAGRDAPRAPANNQARMRPRDDEQPETPKAEMTEHPEPVVLNLWDAAEESATGAASTPDGEAALVAFGGKPARTRTRTRAPARSAPDVETDAPAEPAAAREVSPPATGEALTAEKPAARTRRTAKPASVSETPTAESGEGVEEKPAPRRRGRPRKAEAVPAGD